MKLGQQANRAAPRYFARKRCHRDVIRVMDRWQRGKVRRSSVDRLGRLIDRRNKLPEGSGKRFILGILSANNFGKLL